TTIHGIVRAVNWCAFRERIGFPLRRRTLQLRFAADTAASTTVFCSVRCPQRIGSVVPLSSLRQRYSSQICRLTPAFAKKLWREGKPPLHFRCEALVAGYRYCSHSCFGRRGYRGVR